MQSTRMCAHIKDTHIQHTFQRDTPRHVQPKGKQTYIQAFKTQRDLHILRQPENSGNIQTSASHTELSTEIHPLWDRHIATRTQHTK
jgi:hypothetical protein